MNIFRQDKNEELRQLQMLIAEGDGLAFRKLFDSFFNQLTQFAFSLVKSKQVATEVVDDVFIALWKNRATISKIDNLRVYLYSATKNKALNYLSRKAQLNIYEPFDDLQIQLSDSDCPENLMISKELLYKIQAAVNDLPPRCKIIFKLVREDGLKYKEVAEILNLSVKTVDAQMVVAVARIREQLQHYLIFPKKSVKK